jgi:uncharacterized protein
MALCVAANACVFVQPAYKKVGPPPPTLGGEAVTFQSGSGATIHAWYVPGSRGDGAVLLFHGMGANRSAMLDRAEFLHGQGFTILAPDFQAHGESKGGGDHITLGALESLDAEAAMNYLRARAPGERIGVIGVSLGGAAALLGHGPLPVDAFVLESVYPTLHAAVQHRMQVWLGPLGFVSDAATPILLRLIGPEIGVTERAMHPIDAIARIKSAVLVIAGTADRYTPIAETRALFARAPEPKQLWEVAGAGHEDLYAYAGAEYERRVGAFLAAQLRKNSDAPITTSDAHKR